MRTQDLDDIIGAVTKVYCPHSAVVTQGKVIDAVLTVNRHTFQPLVELSYNAPVRIDAGNFPRLFLMMHCANGAASTTQENKEAEWHQGQTMPFSAGLRTTLWFDRSFIQNGLRLDANKLESLCARWLGRPLEEQLCFALRPFSVELERVWQNTLNYLASWDSEAILMAPTAKAALDEFLLTLLLHHHPHNYSSELAEDVPAAVPNLIRRAERYMIENATTEITVSDVAAHLGISMRSLQGGFRQWRGTTPSAFLRQIRLQLVRDELLKSDSQCNITTIALRHGFSHMGRFSARYRSVFGEPPSATQRRSRSK
jgi:AraC-like DNA-binding protein